MKRDSRLRESLFFAKVTHCRIFSPHFSKGSATLPLNGCGASTFSWRFSMNRCLIAIASFVCVSAGTLLSGCTPAYIAPAIGPIPTSSPSSAPSGTVTASVPSVSFSGTAAQSFTVSETGYSGSFTATSSNTAVATVAETSSTTSARRRDTTTTTTFTVTPVGGGTATITVSDQNGNSISIPVSVTSVIFAPELQR
jgi:hypothetical protein